MADSTRSDRRKRMRCACPGEDDSRPVRVAITPVVTPNLTGGRSPASVYASDGIRNLRLIPGSGHRVSCDARRMPCRRQTSAEAAALDWAPLSVWRTTPRTRPPRAATAILIASVTSEVRMWSAIDQPATFLEQMSITGARWSHVEPTAMQVMSPHHLVFSVSAVKSRMTRSGAGGAVLSSIVVRFFFRRCRPTMWWIRISRVTRLRLIFRSLERSSAWTRGSPVVRPLVFGVEGADPAPGPLLLGPPLGAGLFGGQMTVVAGAGRSAHPADRLHAEIGAVLGDEVPAVGAYFTSRAK